MAGWRLGWLLSPPEHQRRARAYVGNLFLTAPSLSQHVGLAAFDCLDELNGHLAVYARNRALLLAELPQMGLTAIAPPDGAFYIYADIGHLTDDSLSFCRALLQDTGVATAPGVDFDPVEGHHFIRFSFALSAAQVEDAVTRIRTWLAARS
jgi:aspartate/methionine/tyrosine aminotransferase